MLETESAREFPAHETGDVSREKFSRDGAAKRRTKGKEVCEFSFPREEGGGSYITGEDEGEGTKAKVGVQKFRAASLCFEQSG